MSDLSHRSRATELMDTETVTAEDMAACLDDLAAVNTVTLARLPTLGFMARAARRAPGRVLRVVDVACGGGDMLRRIARWAARGGHPVVLTGIDLNPLCIRAARAATPDWMPIEYLRADVFKAGTFEADVFLSALFTHHLDDPAVVEFLQMMEARAAVGWFVNDLHRHAVAYHGFQALSALAGWHRFVRHDGPVSVARGFRRAEWQALLAQARIRGAELRWHPPFRWCVGRLK